VQREGLRLWPSISTQKLGQVQGRDPLGRSLERVQPLFQPCHRLEQPAQAGMLLQGQEGCSLVFQAVIAWESSSIR